ncbi:caspase family protein [Pseudorhodoplanes sp.]|uniref:caspase family protein n=1 Tax=Pseudorhodoplanes sp. TaxID=1934341 RepID=UPI003D0F80B6
MALVTCAMAVWLLQASEAMASKRIALVIGIDQYSEFPKSKQLKNAVNDARAVGKALENINFSVTYLENATKFQMSHALGTLEQQVSPGDVVFLFFAGHGVDFGGTNYLLPKDFPTPVDKQGRRLPERPLKDASFNASEVLSSIQNRGARAVIAVFDACREPFDDEGKRSLNLKAGLAEMKAHGTFIMFSAGAKQLSLDSLSTDDPNPNSVFTRTLVPLLQRPDLSLVTLAKQVQPTVKDLAQKVGHLQTPAYYDEIIGDFYLVERGARPQSAPQISEPQRDQPQDPCGGASEHWRSTESIGTRGAFVDHRNRFSRCNFAGLADARIAALDREEEQRRRRSEDDERRRKALEDEQRRQREIENEDRRRRAAIEEEQRRQREQDDARREERRQDNVAEPSVCKGRGSLWSVQGGVAFLEGLPNSPARKFYLCQSGGSVRARPGSLVFSGSRSGSRYQGTAYVHTSRCGSFPYGVTGQVSNGDRRVTISGRRPNVNESTCKVSGHSNTSLQFDYIRVN